MFAVEFGKLRSKSSARRAPVGAEIEQQRGLAFEGARGAFAVEKAGLGNERRNSILGRHWVAVSPKSPLRRVLESLKQRSILSRAAQPSPRRRSFSRNNGIIRASQDGFPGRSIGECGE